MTARAGTALPAAKRMPQAATPVHTINDGAEAARLQHAVIGWVNEKTGSGALQILSDATLVYDIRDGEMVFIDHILYGLNTVSDTVHVEVGFTDTAGGLGSFTPLSAYRHVTTGAALSGFEEQSESFPTPRVARYSEGARSVTFRIQTNDGSAQVTLEWSGWIEKEP